MFYNKYPIASIFLLIDKYRVTADWYHNTVKMFCYPCYVTTFVLGPCPPKWPILTYVRSCAVSLHIWRGVMND